MATRNASALALEMAFQTQMLVGIVGERREGTRPLPRVPLRVGSHRREIFRAKGRSGRVGGRDILLSLEEQLGSLQGQSLHTTEHGGIAGCCTDGQRGACEQRETSES